MQSEDGSSMSMIPYLHFTRGDALWLREIAPKSKGAVAGACIFLFALGIFERFYTSWSARIQARWALSARAVMNTSSSPSVNSEDKDTSRTAADMTAIRAYPRTITPFVLRYDIPRGLLFVGQSILRYMLMLVVMTYSASYIISVLIGLSVGEMTFGRFAYESVAL